jgi:hypothetical protein
MRRAVLTCSVVGILIEQSSSEPLGGRIVVKTGTVIIHYKDGTPDQAFKVLARYYHLVILGAIEDNKKTLTIAHDGKETTIPNAHRRIRDVDWIPD